MSPPSCHRAHAADGMRLRHRQERQAPVWCAKSGPALYRPGRFWRPEAGRKAGYSGQM